MSPSPPASGSTSPTRRRANSPSLTLDLSTLPQLVTPSAPSNTLIITNLEDPSTFHPTHLLTIKDLINNSYPLHSWAPIKFFKRIIVSFWTVESAVAARSALDGTTILGHRVRIYFGEPTPIGPVDNHLSLPPSDKLFFISPPPSPPHGWEMRNEEPPNKEVHAEDLSTALSKLHARAEASIDPPTPTMSADDEVRHITRERSGSSTIVYHPNDHGDSPHLPAIAVEDLTGTEFDASPVSSDGMEGVVMTSKPKTVRPPVELMSYA